MISAVAPLAAGETRTHQGVDGVEIVLFQHPQAGYLIRGRRDGAHAADLCSQHNLESDALCFWAELIRLHPAALEVGEQKSCAAGNATVTLVRTERTFVITTIVGGARVDDWSRAYDNEIEARAEARRTATVLRGYGSDLTVITRRAELLDQMRDALRVHGARGELLRAGISAELTEIETLADRKAMASLGRRFAA